MSLYADLQKFALENNSLEIDQLLFNQNLEKRGKLFSLALENEDFLTLNALLEWGTDRVADVCLFFNIGLDQKPTLDIATILIDHNFRSEHCIDNYQAVWDIIQHQDAHLAEHLKRNIDLLKQLEFCLKDDIARTVPQTIRHTIFSKLFNLVCGAKLHDVPTISESVRYFYALDALLISLFESVEPWLLSNDEQVLIQNEIELAYKLFLENPFYANHCGNLVTRVKKLSDAFGVHPISSVLQYWVAQLHGESSDLHSTLIEATAAIKEHPDIILGSDTGQCYGYTLMASQAMWVDDVDTFDERLRLLQNTPVTTLKSVLEKNRQYILANKILAKKRGREAGLSETQLQYLELDIFLQNMGYVQSSNFHPELGASGHNSLELMPIIMSKKLAEAGGIVSIRRFTHYYDHTSLFIYLRTLRKIIDERVSSSTYIVIHLGCQDHIEVVGYNTKKHFWIIYDANGEFQPKATSSEWLAATNIMYDLRFGHTTHDHREIATEVYAPQSHERTVKEIFDRWDGLTQVQKIHGAQRECALSVKKPIYSHICSSEEFAVAANNCQLLRLSLSSNVNVIFDTGYTPLTLTACQGSRMAVDFLVAAGADVNLPYQYAGYSYSPLYMSCVPDTTEILKLLLLSGKVTSDKYQIDLIGQLIRYYKKTAHLKVLLINAQYGVLEWLMDPIFLDIVLELLPGESERLTFFSEEYIQFYLLQWVTDITQLQKILENMPDDQRYFFLKQRNIQKLLSYWQTSHSNLIIELLKYLPDEHKTLFFELDIIVAMLQDSATLNEVLSSQIMPYDSIRAIQPQTSLVSAVDLSFFSFKKSTSSCPKNDSAMQTNINIDFN